MNHLMDVCFWGCRWATAWFFVGFFDGILVVAGGLLRGFSLGILMVFWWFDRQIKCQLNQSFNP
jgi:hypothetical protein